MSNVWLVLTNPYMYDKAMEKASHQAEKLKTGLTVVFLISEADMQEMLSELGDMGWLGTASVRRLEESMIEGYRALAQDVLQRVERKVAPVETQLEGVIENISLEDYLRSLLAQGIEMLIVSVARLPTFKFSALPHIKWVEEN